MVGTVDQTTPVNDTTQNVNAVDPATVNSINNNPYIVANNAQATTATTPNAATNVAPAAATTNPVIPSLTSFDTNKFLIGAAIGALGAYLLTNENAQKAIFKTVAKGSEMFTMGMEEMKERFEDAKAEMEAQKSE